MKKMLYENKDGFKIKAKLGYGIYYYYDKIIEAMVKYGMPEVPEIDTLKEIAKIILEYTSTKKFRRKSYYRREEHNNRELFVYYILNSIIDPDSNKIPDKFFEGLLEEIDQERRDFDYELFTR